MACRAAQLRIEAPIGRDPQSRIRMAVVARASRRRPMSSVIAPGDALQRLRCTLHTGRTHQIRVHLASQGIRWWPTRSTAAPALGMQRQALHAARLEFATPCWAGCCRSGRPPADFAAAWNRSRTARRFAPASLQCSILRDALPGREAPGAHAK
jgi:23S rRNA pseudouridine1911/1915/1917 synthase